MLRFERTWWRAVFNSFTSTWSIPLLVYCWLGDGYYQLYWQLLNADMMSHIPTVNSLFLDLEIIMKIKFQLPLLYLTIDDFGYYAKVRFDISFSYLCTYLWHTNIMKINPEKSLSYVGNLYVFNCFAISVFLPFHFSEWVFAVFGVC